VQKLGQLLADFVQTFRPAAKMVSIAGTSAVSRVVTALTLMVGHYEGHPACTNQPLAIYTLLKVALHLYAYQHLQFPFCWVAQW